MLTRLLREEGVASVARRLSEHARETAREIALLSRRCETRCTILNVTPWPLRPGFGGVGVQLRDRLAEEARERKVALLRGGVLDGALEIDGGGHGARRLRVSPSSALHDETFATSFAAALQSTGARVVHIEGAAGVPWDTVIERTGNRTLVLSLHDFALWSASSHLVQGEPSTAHLVERRLAAKRLLARADAVVFSSAWLLERHAELFGLDRARWSVIEPGIGPVQQMRTTASAWKRIAFASAFHEHKGVGLLAEVIRETSDLSFEWHLFGGGDSSPFSRAGVRRHGFYRSHELPALLVRHSIDLLLLPSIVPESFSLTVSQAWSAGVPVLAFDHGAVADRVRASGGGWLADPARGAEALIDQLRAWSTERRATIVPANVPTARHSAAEMLALYRAIENA